MKETIIHPFGPIYDENSRILILGSMPSSASRAAMFPYAHPQNRFWKALEVVFKEKIIDKKEFLKRHHIALWDTIASCEIVGASDSSITNVKVNDIKSVVDKSKITHIFTTGKKSYELYTKYLENIVGIKAIYLPSSSPANAAIKFEDLVDKYSEIKNYL